MEQDFRQPEFIFGTGETKPSFETIVLTMCHWKRKVRLKKGLGLCIAEQDFRQPEVIFGGDTTPLIPKRKNPRILI